MPAVELAYTVASLRGVDAYLDVGSSFVGMVGFVDVDLMKIACLGMLVLFADEAEGQTGCGCSRGHDRAFHLFVRGVAGLDYE